MYWRALLVGALDGSLKGPSLSSARAMSPFSSPGPGRENSNQELTAEDAFRLLDVVHALSTASGFDAIVEVVKRSARQLLRAEGVTFVLREGEYCYYADEDAIGPLWKGLRFPAKSCISGWVMKHRESVAIEDIFADPRIPIDAYRTTFVRSLAMAPVRRSDPIAAIGAYWDKTRAPSARELALLQHIADSAAVGLANAQLNRELEHALGDVRGTEQRLQLALDSAAIGTWDYNPQTGALDWDTRCRAIFGITPDARLTYSTFLSAIHPDDRDWVNDTIEQVLSTSGSNEYDVRFRIIRLSDSRLRWIAARGRAIFDVYGRASRFIGTVIDVTEQKTGEQELERAIQVRDEFLCVAGHELRTPLAALLLQVQGAKQRLEQERLLTPGAAARLERAAASAQRLGRLIDNILDVSRITTGQLVLEPEPLDLSALLRDVLARFQPVATRAGCELELHAPAELWGSWDRERLDQIASHLIHNAIKYGRGKPISLHVARVRDAEGEAERVALTVRDHGIGLAPEVRDRIFQRFERAVPLRHYGGLGLGLWIVRQIVDAASGTVHVESTPGAGAQFTVTLPITPA